MRKHYLISGMGIFLCFLFILSSFNCQLKPIPTKTICGFSDDFFVEGNKMDCYDFDLPIELQHYEDMLSKLDARKQLADTLGKELKTGIQLFQEMDNVKYKILIIELKKYYSEYLYSQGKAKKGMDLLEESIELLKPQLNNACDSSMFASLHSYIGLDYHHLSDYDKSIEHLTTVLELNQALKDVPQIALAYSNLTLPLLKKGEVDVALSYGQKANCIWRKIGYPTDKKDMFLSTQLNYATASLEKGKRRMYRGEMGQSSNLLNEAQNIYRKIAEIIQLDSTLSIQERQELSIYNFFNLGVNTIILRKIAPVPIDTAYYQQIFKEIQVLPESPHKNHYLNLGNTLMGVLYAHANNCDKGEKSVEKAINDAVFSIADSADLSNAYVYHKIQFLQTLHARAQVKEICFANSKDINDLIAAFENYLDIIDFVENVRNGFAVEAYKQNLNNTVRKYYSKAASIAIQLYQLTNNTKYLNQAFQITDKGKSILLQEELASKLQLQTLPQGHPLLPFLRKEKAFEKQLNQLHTQLIKANQNNLVNQEKILKEQIEEATKAYQDFIANLQNGNIQAQKFYWSKKGKTPPSISFVQQNWLDTNTAIIAYEFGVELKSSLAFLVTKNQEFAIPLEMDSSIFSLVDYFEMGIKDTLPFYRTEAYQLYQKVFAPIAEKLPSSIKKLVFIPNGTLNRIQFQALLTKPVDSKTPYHQLPYLIKNFDITYLPSLSVYEMLLATQSNNQKKFTGFIANPSDSLISDLKKLGLKNSYLSVMEDFKAFPTTTKSAVDIHEKFFPNQFLDTKSSKTSFIDNANNSKIIHIAAHGYYDAQNDSILNFLSFLPSIDDNGVLTIQELYGLNLNADLVVLSSCYSNEGKFNPMEGVMSFSRAFLHAGCKATIATTDDVDEVISAKIINRFYDALVLNNIPPHRALNNSQRSYLVEARQLSDVAAHPVFWAHYRHTGVDALGLTIFSPD